MKFQTAADIVAKMVVGGYLVSLRKNKHGGISDKTWKALCDVMFSVYNADSMHVTYSKDNTTGFVWAKRKDGSEIFSCNVRLYSI